MSAVRNSYATDLPTCQLVIVTMGSLELNEHTATRQDISNAYNDCKSIGGGIFSSEDLINSDQSIRCQDFRCDADGNLLQRSDRHQAVEKLANDLQALVSDTTRDHFETLDEHLSTLFQVRLGHLDPVPVALLPVLTGESARVRLRPAMEPAARSQGDEHAHEPIDPRHIVRMEEREGPVHVQLGFLAVEVSESLPEAGLSALPQTGVIHWTAGDPRAGGSLPKSSRFTPNPRVVAITGC